MNNFREKLKTNVYISETISVNLAEIKKFIKRRKLAPNWLLDQKHIYGHHFPSQLEIDRVFNILCWSCSILPSIYKQGE